MSTHLLMKALSSNDPFDEMVASYEMKCELGNSYVNLHLDAKMKADLQAY